ncbi:MAG: hypothetical protein EOO88_62535, partial [Pedobacter sp.]
MKGSSYPALAQNSGSSKTRQPLIKANWASFVGQDQDRPPSINRPEGTMTCTGVRIDTIESVGPYIDAQEHGDWVEWTLQLILASLSLPSSGTIPLEEIVEAVLKSTSVSDHFRPPTTIFATDTADYTSHNILILALVLENLYDVQQIHGDKQAFLNTII